MKIKQLPEDFIVEEVSQRKLKQEGPFAIYLLEKKGLDTFGAKRIIGSQFKVPAQDIGVSGLKDKHALTRQFISIPSKYSIPESWIQPSLKLTRVGFFDNPILLGGHELNRFIIVIRDIAQNQRDKMGLEARRVLREGVPNYFDSQRFGSLRGAETFIAKHLIKGEWEAAVKVILTSSTRHDPAQVRHCRIAIAGRWGDWNECLAACKKAPRARRERKMLSYLKNNPTDFIGAFSLVERELQKMYLSAYQSHLWNETVKVLLRRLQPALKLKEVEYPAGKLSFPLEVSQEQLQILEYLEVPLLNPSVVFTSDPVKFAALKVLKEEGVELAQLTVQGRDDLLFKEGLRSAWVRPKTMQEPVLVKDELNAAPGKLASKLTVSFDLPPGSYATVFLKAMGVTKKGRE